MADENLDALITPENTGHYDHWQADTRYLTQVGGNCVDAAAIITADHNPIAFVGESSWPGLAAPHWGIEVLPTNRAFGAAMAPVMADLGLGRARIGVSGLTSGLRAPEGTIKYGTMRVLEAAFPDATFVDATMLFQRARFHKSGEEIALLEHSVALAEKAVDAMVATASPGVRECEVYAAMIEAMVRDGGELPTMLSWVSGPPGDLSQRLTMATGRRIGDRWQIRNEIEARYGGYVSQRMQPVFIGETVPGRLRGAIDAQLEALSACWEAFKPGATLSDLVKACHKAVRGSNFDIKLIAHGRGLGDDGPFVLMDEILMDLGPFTDGTVLVVKPWVLGPDVEPTAWADTVVATPHGARRFGHQPAQLSHLR